MINKLVLAGRLAKDPEFRLTNSGGSIVECVVAYDSESKNSDGEYPTNYLNVKAFGDTAEYISKNGRKGDRIEIVGRLEIPSFMNKEGKRVYKTECILDWVRVFRKTEKEDTNDTPAEENKPSKKSAVMDTSNLQEVDMPDDDLPF